jgi:ribosomal protein S18 acetylase RimI-like enzyme
MDGPVDVRRARPEDLRAVSRLAVMLVEQHREYDPRRFVLPEPVEDGYFRFLRTEVGDPRAVLLVAVLDGEIVGYLYGRMEPPSFVELRGEAGWIHDLYVLERGRGRGAGGALLDAGVRALEQCGARSVMLSVSPQNDAGRRLFGSRGFENTMLEMTRQLRRSS